MPTTFRPFKEVGSHFNIKTAHKEQSAYYNAATADTTVCGIMYGCMKARSRLTSVVFVAAPPEATAITVS
jgi:hypothetical protein